MLSTFFKNTPTTTRFEKSELFKQTKYILTKIKYKEKELEQASKSNGSGTIDHNKYICLLNLNKQIDAAINNFNACNDASGSDEFETIDLTRTLIKLITFSLRENMDILQASRNNYRKNLSNAVYYGTFGATITAGTVISIGTLGKLATLLYVAPTLSKTVHSSLGLNNLSSKSIRLINELESLLQNINIYLTKKQSLTGLEYCSDHDYYTCPITQEIINDPVVCTLDGQSYERKAIEKWLTKKRTSPINRCEIPEGKLVEDVLVKHYNYIHLLDKYIRDNPCQNEMKLNY
ncbi:hypothetical protein N9L02_03150 [Gammaproteobacteria bacterium]|nr:hypothetical protein [Gammaproteobacteria bacterium]